MAQRQINAPLFLQMMQEGCRNLTQHVEVVNALNVFPVPDGDTGTNMNLTLTSGVKEMEKCASTAMLGEYAKALSMGLLMGARGNSGVILSQLFRGFAKSVSERITVSARQLAEAFQAGVETAYRAVIKPVEGTILTVSREAAEAGVKQSRKTEDATMIMEVMLESARSSLSRTPNLLPVLKQANVVDAGGQGLIFIFEGILAALKGEVKERAALPPLSELHEIAHEHPLVDAQIEHGYCTEFIVRLKETSFQEEPFKKGLTQFGDSLLVVADESLVKVHIHAEHPGDVLNYGMKYGDLVSIKIDNMREQYANIKKEASSGDVKDETSSVVSSEAKKKQYGIMAVATGQGIANIFRSIGADVVIEGGQSMNPSTEEMVSAMQSLNAEHVFVLPNNKNIILTAEQLKEVVSSPITVLPTKTIPQGLAALLAFCTDASPEENQEKMTAYYSHVRSGEVTYAVRDSKVNGLEIHKGDYLGILEGEIQNAGPDLEEACRKLLRKMLTDESSIVTIIYGEESEESQAQELSRFIEQIYPSVEVEIYDGGQPLYQFLFSVE